MGLCTCRVSPGAVVLLHGNRCPLYVIPARRKCRTRLMSARQFFDVWTGAVQGVKCALEPMALPESACREAVECVVAKFHGPEVGAYAANYFDRVLREHRFRSAQ